MKKEKLFILFIILMSVICVSCGEATVSLDHTPAQASTIPTAQTNDVSNKQTGTITACYLPVASGIHVFGNQLAEIDLSNASEGYAMVQYLGNNAKVKLQITCPDDVTYTYNLRNGYEAFPLTAGNGVYKIAVYENVKDNQYSTAYSMNADIRITNEFGPYLYANQYVNFTDKSKVVSKAEDLSSTCSSELNVVASIYEFVSSNIVYDHEKAATVQSGYTSDVDEILYEKKGICLDYAAVMASMLRSQSIPTRLEVGYASSAYHAWISTYISEIGWINGIIRFDGESWSIMDPTFAANSDETALKSFIGNGSNYQTKYVY